MSEPAGWDHSPAAAWEGSEAALAGLAYVEACTPLFEALDGAANTMIARGWDPREAHAVVAWNYVSTVLAHPLLQRQAPPT